MESASTSCPAAVSLQEGPEKAAVAQQARFQRLLDETWAQLPLAVRESLEKHWRQNGCVGVFISDWPTVTLNGQERHYTGFCRGDGCLFCFYAPLVAELEDRLVGALIAHEFGHAYGFMKGTPTGERLNDLMVESWGFPMADLRERLGQWQPELLSISIDYGWYEKWRAEAEKAEMTVELFVHLFLTWFDKEQFVEFHEGLNKAFRRPSRSTVLNMDEASGEANG